MLRFGIMERSTDGPRGMRGGARALALLAAAVLAGCSDLPKAANPIEWYRDAAGVSQNDSVPTRNVQNLEAGRKEPYPNLGSVPPPPTRATTGAERRKLQQALAADRSQARASDAQLQSGQVRSGGGPTWNLLGVGAQSERPNAAANASGPASSAPASSETASAGGAPPAGAAGTPGTGPGTGGRQERLAARGSEAPPSEAPFTSPSVRAVPAGEVPRAPPPPAELAAVAAPTRTPVPPPTSAIEPRPVPASPTVPPPAAAAIPPTPGSPDRVAMAAPNAPLTGPGYNLNQPGKPPGAPLDVAEIKFADGAMKLTNEDQERLVRVARLFQEKGGTIRVVGYGRRGYGPDAAQQELASFSDAIQRARLVGEALAKLGLPQDKIQVQAAPIGDGLGENRAEVLLER